MVTEGPSRTQVPEIFAGIAGRYDRVNRFLSFGQDRRWRKAAVKLLPSEHSRVLDLATGTGDLAFAVSRALGVKEVIGLDRSLEMLNVARSKVSERSDIRVEFLYGDALNLPFPDASFDVVTMGFGIRNVEDPDQCLREMHRVLTPGGRVIILEFSRPVNPILRVGHAVYMRYVLPFIGGLLTGQVSAYRYLAQSVATFPSGKAFLDRLEAAGFSKISSKRLMLGAVTVYAGERIDSRGEK